MALRKWGLMLPAFSTTAWTAIKSGKTKKFRESLPHSPSIPLLGPMGLSCWQGDPPMIRSMAPGSILDRM
eukprot:13079232-Heterocapsa_arctica.AAC.1